MEGKRAEDGRREGAGGPGAAPPAASLFRSAARAARWGRDTPPSVGLEAARRPRSGVLPLSDLSFLLCKMGSLTPPFHSTGENHGARAVRSRGAQWCSSDGGCGGAGLGPPGTRKLRSRDTPSLLGKPGARAAGARGPWFWSASPPANGPPTSATPAPVSLQSRCPRAWRRRVGEAWVSCCPTCPPHSPTPLPGEWGRQAWSVGPAGAECSSAGSWAPSRQSESVLVMGRGPATGTVTACSQITIG